MVSHSLRLGGRGADQFFTSKKRRTPISWPIMKYCFLLMTLILAVGCEQDNAPSVSVQTDAADASPAAPAEVSSSAFLAEEEAKKRVALLTVGEAVKGFKVIEKRFPATLDEVVQRGFLHSLPALPAGGSFAYDAETGEVSWQEK